MNAQALFDRKVSKMTLEQRWRFLAEATELGSLTNAQLIELARSGGVS